MIKAPYSLTSPLCRARRAIKPAAERMVVRGTAFVPHRSLLVAPSGPNRGATRAGRNARERALCEPAHESGQSLVEPPIRGRIRVGVAISGYPRRTCTTQPPPSSGRVFPAQPSGRCRPPGCPGPDVRLRQPSRRHAPASPLTSSVRAATSRWAVGSAGATDLSSVRSAQVDITTPVIPSTSGYRADPSNALRLVTTRKTPSARTTWSMRSSSARPSTKVSRARSRARVCPRAASYER
jgi:hypothetical protein